MKCRACILVTLCWLSLSHSSFAQGTAFTYQGQLMDAGQPANGIYDMEFTVYKVPTGGIIAGGPLVHANVAVSNGLFTATLDFGDIVFNGSPRWLQIAVRSNGVAAPRYGLTPRQSLLPAPYAIRAGSVTGPITGNQIAAGTIGSAQLAPGAASQNLMASGQSGVAGGGVVLSESLDAPNLIQAGYSKVGTVDLAAEAWIPRSGPGPAARSGFSTVWTGSEYIIWGGLPYVNTGARYNPKLNRWLPVSTLGAPEGRTSHTAVWTGKEMIVWGGSAGYLNTGGRYNPVTDTWKPTSLVNVPGGRDSHCAVWTGKEMIIFGGYVAGNPNLATGGRYDPELDTWTPMSANSFGTSNPRAVWTGTEMVVSGFSSSARVWRYNPANNGWTGSSFADPFVYIDRDHTPIWTGTEIIYWKNPTESRKYFVGSDSWGTLTTANAPSGSFSQTLVWTGTQMLIWGGTPATSARYTPSQVFNEWSGMSTNNGILPLGIPIWTGEEMLTWAGGAVGRYNPVSNTWTQATQFIPAARTSHASVWTGDEMIIWGGADSVYLASGGRYKVDSWTPTSTVDAPAGRSAPSAVWTGFEMVVWGGYSNGWLRTGGRYDPATDAWLPTTTTDAPMGRSGHTAVWTGGEMLVWGGNTNQSTSQRVNTGGRYIPWADIWSPISTDGAPQARALHTAVWTGTEMIIWGGQPTIGALNTGGRYNPATDTWLPTSTVNAPEGTMNHVAVWTGSEMIVWGGPRNNMAGGRYNPVTDTWRSITLVNAPVVRQRATAIWNRKEMIVWGGYDSNSQALDSGGRYDPATDTWSALTLANAPSPRYQHTAEWAGSEFIVFGGYSGSQTLNSTHSYLPPKRMTLYLRP